MFGQEINGEAAVMHLLCPHGENMEACQEVMESATDVASLPGKISSDGNTNVLNQLAKSLVELMAYQSLQRRGLPTHDSQWQSDSKNALAKISKSSAKLDEALEDLTSQRDSIIGNMSAKVRTILNVYNFPDTDITMYLEEGLLPRVIHRTFDWYYQLMVTASSMEATDRRFDYRTGSFLAYHAKKLQMIRNYALSRHQLIIQVYIYLRDTQSDGFIPLGYLRQELRSLHSSGASPNGKSEQCTKCKSNCHKGGRSKCPYQEVDNAKAKMMGKEAAKIIQQEPDAEQLEIYAGVLELHG
jgi:hypothetical protein